MSKVVFGIAAAFLIAFSAWMGWYKLHPQERGCAHSIALCKPPDGVKAAKDCREVLSDLRQRRGGSIERMAANCMLESESCNESLSCLSHADRRANELKN